MHARVRIRWFLSFLGVIALPFVIGILVFLRGEELLRRETDRVHQSQLSVLVYGLDSVLKEIRALEVAMIQDPELEGLVSHAYDRREEYLVARHLIQRYGARNIDPLTTVQWMVYLPEDRRVLSASGYTQDTNYLDLYGRPAWTLGQWRLQMRSLRNQRLQLVSTVGWPEQDGESTVVYARVLRSARSPQTDAVLAFAVSTPVVSQLIATMLDRAEDAVIIADGHTQIVLGAEGVAADLDPASGEARGADRVSLDGRPYRLYRDRSQQLPLEIAYALAERGAFAALRSHRRASVVAMLVCLFLAVVLSGYLVMRHYGPVRRLLELVLRSQGSAVRLESDEFRVIEHRLVQAMDETDELRSVVLGHERSLELYRFRSLLRGGSDDDAGATEFFASAGVTHFVVLVLDPVPTSRVADVGCAAAATFDAAYTPVDVVAMAGGVCVVIGWAGPPDETCLDEATRRLHHEVQVRAGSSVALASSSIRSATDSPRAAVKEALNALEYRIVEGTNHVLKPHLTTMPRDTFEFTLQQENELSNRILAGDFPGARSITSQILQTNFEKRSLSIEMGRCLAFSLATMFIRSLNRVARYRENHLWDALRPIDRIASCLTYEQLRATIVDLLEAVCADIEAGRQSHTEVLLAQVIDYITERLKSPNLGTKEIADRFDMNPAYLSRVFKEHSGLSFSDYINQRRIEISKGLLGMTDRTIADIGQEIGYPESSSFIRFFRKYEGVTPGQFRERAG